jgi:hypothetical protein
MTVSAAGSGLRSLTAQPHTTTAMLPIASAPSATSNSTKPTRSSRRLAPSAATTTRSMPMAGAPTAPKPMAQRSGGATMRPAASFPNATMTQRPADTPPATPTTWPATARPARVCGSRGRIGVLRLQPILAAGGLKYRIDTCILRSSVFGRIPPSRSRP